MPLVAAGDVHMHARSRRALQDVLTATRIGTTVDRAGYALFPNGERHLRAVVPNAYPAVLVFGTMMIGSAILGEAGLSYLGIGITPPGAAWGAMVAAGFPYLLTNPVMSVAPGVCIMLVVFAFNMVGDGLRDVLDPRLRGTM